MARIKTNAQFFATDAIIALTIIIITIITISPIVEQSKQESTITADILESLSSLSVGEFNNTYVQQLITENKISDTSKPLLEQIGEFYVTNLSLAKNLASEALNSIPINENVGIWYGDTLIASKNSTPFETAENIFTDRQIISGIGGGGTGVTGFSTRAFLSSSSQIKYAYFGGYVGEGNISTIIEYKGEIKSAEIELVINKNFEIEINGNSQGIFNASPDDFTPANYSLNTTDFASGDNNIEIKGDNLHIAGGFIKISYDGNVSYEQPTRYYFPGIKGIINLYDGFYVPGNLTGLSISLHFNNTIDTFLSLGKTQVFNASSNGTSPITISNTTLSSLLNFSDISRKTIPIRFGMDDMDYVVNNSRDIDVISVTDISGSMCDCSDTSWSWWWGYCRWNQGNCESSPSCDAGSTCTGGIYDAKDANDLFIEMILNDSGNRVGLTAYSSSALDSNYHELSDNETSLKEEVSSWSAYGGTCICCGINKAVAGLIADSNSSKFRSIVMMSDGSANVECSEQNTGDPNDDAVQSACDAYANHGIKVYTIAFGNNANNQTLMDMANCGNGTFYSTVDDLSDVYEKIAEELVETSYYEQTAAVSSDFFSELYSDSYIEFDYEKEEPSTGIITTITKPFTNSLNATFSLPLNSSLLEARAISYSGPRWTSLLEVNNNTVYNLSAYEEDFLKLGDPYSINIPIEATSENNSLTLQTGVSPENMSEGSASNKVIYTISKNLSSYTSVSASAEGCNWTIQFNEYNLTIPIPSDYTGTKLCEYSSSSYCDIYPNCNGATDSAQIAVYNLFKLLDFDSDGDVDVDLSAEDMQIATSNLEGVPFLFSTEVQVRKWH